MRIDGGKLSWTPTADDIGSYVVAVEASSPDSTVTSKLRLDVCRPYVLLGTSPKRLVIDPAGRRALVVGGAADVCIFDADAPVRISRETLRSQGKNTPYLGRELLGRVSATLVSGQVVYEAPARH